MAPAAIVVFIGGYVESLDVFRHHLRVAGLPRLLRDLPRDPPARRRRGAQGHVRQHRDRGRGAARVRGHDDPRVQHLEPDRHQAGHGEGGRLRVPALQRGRQLRQLRRPRRAGGQLLLDHLRLLAPAVRALALGLPAARAVRDHRPEGSEHRPDRSCDYRLPARSDHGGRGDHAQHCGLRRDRLIRADDARPHRAAPARARPRARLPDARRHRHLRRRPRARDAGRGDDVPRRRAGGDHHARGGRDRGALLPPLLAPPPGVLGAGGRVRGDHVRRVGAARRMNPDQLRRAVGDGSIDTVLLVFADMQGRLQGKRLVGQHFVEDVLEHDAEACNYLLAVDVDMNTVEGYAMASWEQGYGDFVMKPDLSTLRPVPWHEGTAMCMADLVWHDEKPVVASPRQILRRQLDRLAERGWEALAATELEFIVFRDTYEEAFEKTYRDLVPGNQYNVDYSILGTSRLEPLLGRIRREMAAAGLRVENSKGECNLGQHEINFTYEDALSAADTHTIYKNGAKELASQEGYAITFMAKYNEREGNSCHIHLSLRGKDDTPVFAEQPELFDRFLAGQLACLRELTLLKAPNINSYKRFAEGSFAPTAVAWGRDNRTCSMRVIGEGHAKRVESRLAGGDVNPYLAIAAMIAAGLHGIDNELELEEPLEGNAYTSGKPHVPATLQSARDLLAASTMAREAFGEDVVAHYLNNADVELRAFEAAVTDWERFRGFERL